MRFAKQFVIVQWPAQLFDNLVGRNEVITSDFLSNKPEQYNGPGSLKAR